MNVTKTLLVKCPECGGDATIETIEDRVAMYTGEYIDEGQPEIVTETLTGWYLKCQNPECGFDDCEPPTW